MFRNWDATVALTCSSGPHGGSSTRTFLSWPAWMLKRSNRAFCSATCFWPWGSLGQMFKTEEFNSDDDDEYSCSYNLLLGTRLLGFRI